MSLKLEDIKHLAQTSRIDISDEEMQGLLGDLEATLVYIEQINEAQLPSEDFAISGNYNATREDIVTNNRGENTEILLAQAVDKKDNYLKVKKIL